MSPAGVTQTGVGVTWRVHGPRYTSHLGKRLVEPLRPQTIVRVTDALPRFR